MPDDLSAGLCYDYSLGCLVNPTFCKRTGPHEHHHDARTGLRQLLDEMDAAMNEACDPPTPARAAPSGPTIYDIIKKADF